MNRLFLFICAACFIATLVLSYYAPMGWAPSY